MPETILPKSNLEGCGPWNSFKTTLVLIISSTDKIEAGYKEDMEDVFLPSPYWNPLSPLYFPVRDILAQQSESFRELPLTSTLIETAAKLFRSKCCKELTHVKNNVGLVSESNDWKELYLEMMCLCISFEDNPHLCVLPDSTTSTDSSPNANALLKRQACKSLSEALVAYPLAHHTLHTAVQTANNEICGGKDDNSPSEEQQKKFISRRQYLILRLSSSCARLSLRLLSLLMDSSSGTLFLKKDDMCYCLSAVLPLTADFTVGVTTGEAWEHAESLLPPLPCHHGDYSHVNNNSTHPPPAPSILYNSFPWEDMRNMSSSVQWPQRHEVVLPCSLMLLREARDVVRCICDGFGGNLSSLVNASASAFSSAFKKNIQMCKEMRPTYHDTSAIEERSLSLTGSKIPLVNRFAQSPNPEPSIAIGIAIMTEEACKCSSSMNDHNVGREGGVVSRPGFSDINALGELLPVILPFADHWEPSIASLGLTSLLRVVVLSTPTQISWHLPLLLEHFGRSMKVLRDEAARSLAVAGVAAVLAAVPSSEVNSTIHEAGNLLKECDFGLVPHVAIVLGLLIPMFELKITLGNPCSELLLVTSLRCIHSLCVACWPRIPAHEMTIMPVLIGFCYELKKKNSLFREDNNTSDGEIKGNAASRRAISSHAMKVSAFVHILCSLQGTHYNDDAENDTRVLNMVSTRISCLRPVCQDVLLFVQKIERNFLNK